MIMRNLGWILEMKKLSALISTLQIFRKISSKQAVWLQGQIFVNAENFCVVAHIKFFIKFKQKAFEKNSEEWKMLASALTYRIPDTWLRQGCLTKLWPSNKYHINM